MTKPRSKTSHGAVKKPTKRPAAKKEWSAYTKAPTEYAKAKTYAKGKAKTTKGRAFGAPALGQITPPAQAGPTTRRLSVVLEAESEGGYSAWVPELPGCASQGETREEALTNIREAIACHREAQKKLGLRPPKVEVVPVEAA